MASEIHRIIVGTAGHIDHGKSSLVRVLTGIDPDRLKEEKDRGMTIDLGFAPYSTAAGRTVGIIDVPGHERFIKNMVAGACSVDLFLLVVAADDGVMPQTREHVEILDLLGARRGIIIVTKIDLVDPELRELAIEDIEQFLAGTSFEGCPLVAVSSTTGEGIDQARAILDEAIDSTEARSADGLFRMPVQRVFSARGHGTVLTGVPLSGSVHLGDQLEVLPHRFKGKVRGIQAYNEDRDVAAAGHSTALNLSDIDYREVSRGDVVATPGLYRPVRMLEAELRYLKSAPRPLKHGAEVRLHVGTAEALARVVLLNRPILEPGAEALVQFRLREPVVAARGDRFLVRLPTPMITLGGGVIVADSERRLSRLRESSVESVKAKADALHDHSAFLEQVLLERGSRSTPLKDVAVLLKCLPAEADEFVVGLKEAGTLVPVGRDRIVHRQPFQDAVQRLREALRQSHQDNPLRAFADTLVLRTAAHMEEDLFDGALSWLTDNSEVVVKKGGRACLADFEPSLSAADRAARDSMLQRLRESRFTPPSASDLAGETGLAIDRTQALLVLMQDQGDVFRAGDIFFDAGQMEALRAALRKIAAENDGELLVPRVRDALGTTRKYLIPLLEYLDSRGLTVRRGDRRFLVEGVR